MKTFIHHDGAIGDVLLSFPCLRIIRQEAGMINFAGSSEISTLLRETRVVDEISSVGSSLFSSLYVPGGACLNRKTDEFLSAFDQSYVFTVRNDSPVVQNIKLMIPNTRAIITIPPGGIRIHVADFRVRQFGQNMTPEALAFIDVSQRRRTLIKNILSPAGFLFRRPLVILHPGSGGKEKCWPLDRYFALVRRLLQSHDPEFIILSGPAEEGLMHAKINACALDQKRILHLFDMRLIDVATLISMCDCYIGNDSGITHLAAAVNAPVIAIFGPTDPELWRPRGRHVWVLSSSSSSSAGSLDSISVDEVLEAAVRLLEERVCGNLSRNLAFRRHNSSL